MNFTQHTIAVIGLGYVGLPVAVSFSEAGYKVIGYDNNAERILSLINGHDKTNEIEHERLKNNLLSFSNDETCLDEANFFIVTVPTPVTIDLEPDISFLLNASKLIGKFLKADDVVVYESTVYPGCTEEDCIPVLEEFSGLKASKDFHVGYSPERINPGDPNHRFENILKIVSGQTEAALKIISNVYGAVVKAGIYKAESIKVAEAAKVIENTQRDLNIAFVNELSQIFLHMNIDTHDVLKAANTKWNFNLFEPGLVGGHCIGVDPYYLTCKANKIGAKSEIILAGRNINNGYVDLIREQCTKWLAKQNIISPNILILGLTFKENIPDIRNSLVFNLIKILRDIDPRLDIYDPVADADEKIQEIKFKSLPASRDYNVIILAVPHNNFLSEEWVFLKKFLPKRGKVLVMDIKAKLCRESKPEQVDLWRP